MEKKLYELKISESLKHLMPPLSVVELRLLRASLISEGCRDPLVTWNGVLVDGHNRYAICREHSIPFSYVEMDFSDEDDARLWIMQNQLGRRNLTDFQRIELVLPLEPMVRAKAKARQMRKSSAGSRAGQKGGFVVQNSAPQKEPAQQFGKARDEMARLAGVSHDTYDRAKKIAAAADEATKDKLRKGELSIHGAYTALFQTLWKIFHRVAQRGAPFSSIQSTLPTGRQP